MSTTETVSHTPAPESEASLEVNNQHSLPVIITLILLSFFFLGFFSIYFVRCVLTFFIRRGNNTNNVPQSNSKAHGLDPSILSTFPTFVYSSVKDLREDKGILECAVCLSEFEDSDMLRLLTICNHAFHPDCIDLWLGSHTTCPVCRRNLDPSEKPQEISITITDEGTTTNIEGENGNNSRDEEGSQRMISVHENVEEEEEEEREEAEGSSREGRRVDDHHHRHEGREDDDDDDEHIAELERRNRGHVAVDKMLRSHSTGHSIIRSDVDRYTLRLPENVKESITRGHHHNWTASCITFGEFTGDITAGKSGLGEVSGVSSGDVIRV